MILRLAPERDLEIGEFSWRLFDERAGELFDERGLRLDEWIRTGEAVVCKTGPGRTIYRVRLRDLDLYIKRFIPYSTLNLLHQQLREDRARKECELARRLDEEGVPTIKPFALGRRVARGMLRESILVTQAIPDSVTLYEHIERHRTERGYRLPPAQRRGFALELARLTARLHNAGFEHRDLHEKNVVLGRLPDGKHQCHVLDLHELAVHPKLPIEAMKRELSRMGRYFTLRTSRFERFRFLREYVRLRNLPAESLRAFALEMEAGTFASRADFWRRRDTRHLRKSSQHTIRRRGPMFAQFANDLSPELIERLLDDPDLLFHQSGSFWLKRGKYTRVASVAVSGADGVRRYVYKQHRFKGWLEWLACALRPNQAQRAWRSGNSLLLREIPTARPLALIHRLFLGLPVNSWLLMEEIPEAFEMTAYVDRHLPDRPPAERRRIIRGITERTAELLRVMHARNVTHRDLKSTNVLLNHHGDPADPEVWVIDLDGVNTWMRVPERHRLQNLSRLGVSFFQSPWITRTDRLRFLRRYLGVSFRGSPLWKRCWSGIRRMIEAKVRRHRRHGRLIV